jgi:hypothetical protein
LWRRGGLRRGRGRLRGEYTVNNGRRLLALGGAQQVGIEARQVGRFGQVVVDEVEQDAPSGRLGQLGEAAGSKSSRTRLDLSDNFRRDLARLALGDGRRDRQGRLKYSAHTHRDHNGREKSGTPSRAGTRGGSHFVSPELDALRVQL